MYKNPNTYTWMHRQLFVYLLLPVVAISLTSTLVQPTASLSVLEREFFLPSCCEAQNLITKELVELFYKVTSNVKSVTAHLLKRTAIKSCLPKCDLKHPDLLFHCNPFSWMV